MMRKYLIWSLLATLSTALWGCFNITRTETDVYTISERDTTISSYDKNTPGGRDNGIVYPSSRTYKAERSLLQRDSTVDRLYPNFIRLGVFESVGLMGSSSGRPFGTGMFGVFPDFNNLRGSFTGKANAVFGGGLYRLGIGEWRLRWFRDAANWTYGTSAFEAIIPQARTEYSLMSTFPLYIRKRYYLREEIPYIAFTPAVGLGWFPSQYINMTGSIDVGSIGGLNVRAYVGLAGGVNLKNTPLIINSNNNGQSQTSIFPYFGIGMSTLDFLNRVPETETEWKYHEHSSWDVGLMQLTLLYTGTKTSVWGGNTSAFFTGYILKVANAAIALPLLNYKLYAGTSLINLAAFGFNEWGIGILPLRMGYWQTLIQDELTTEPFIEYNYYPSSFFQIADKLNLKISDVINVSFILGYASGSSLSSNAVGTDIISRLGASNNFSRAYIGLNIGIIDRIFFPEQLRYFKK
ncbi:MAG: hypothetical protein ABSG15_14540 [FCB group bacterium]